MELNVDKTNFMVFNKKRKGKKVVWRWKEKRLEKVSHFKYLGFTFNRKENTDNIKEMSLKGRLGRK